MSFTITDFKTEKLTTTDFIKPQLLSYKLNGKNRTWEAVKSFDSVAVLLYHREKDALLLVKQFRAPVYLNNPQITYTYELCAGILDKKTTPKQTAIEEIYEECGYEISKDGIKKITSYFTNVGVSGATQHLFYAEIDTQMRVGNGGGDDSEEILLEWISVSDAKEFMFDESCAKTPGLMFAFSWFLAKQHNQTRSTL